MVQGFLWCRQMIKRYFRNGEGVPEHIQQNLFDAFVTTKSGGGGLGLAVTAKIVAAHGGSIEFDTEPGRTIFRVFLPTFIN